MTAKGGLIFAGSLGNGVYVSADNGATWTPTNNGLLSANISSLVSEGSNLYAGTFGDGVFLSTDDGANWNAVNTNLPEPTVYSLTAIGNEVYAGTNAGVYMTNDAGVNWTLMDNGLSSMVLSVSNDGTNLFACPNGGGVFISTDYGASWTEFNNGLENNPYVYGALNISGMLYIGTGGAGIWSRPFSELTNISVANYDKSLQIFPNPTSGKINFTLENNSSIEKVVLSDISGKVLLELKPQIFSGRIFEIDGTKFSKGIYFLNVYSTNRIDSRKVIIE